MPYVYRTTFDLESKDVDQLAVGRSLQLSIAYLKAFLSSEPGFINSRAMYSLVDDEHKGKTHVSFESTWEDWEALEEHRQHSEFAEEKMLHRFELKVEPKNIAAHVYEEIA